MITFLQQLHYCLRTNASSADLKLDNILFHFKLKVRRNNILSNFKFSFKEVESIFLITRSKLFNAQLFIRLEMRSSSTDKEIFKTESSVIHCKNIQTISLL